MDKPAPGIMSRIPILAGMRYPALTLACCAFAGIRVLLFGAGFPLFNQMDEAEHYDMVGKYSSGAVPSRLMPMEPETVKAVSMFGSWEYNRSPSVFRGRTPPQPVWTLSPDRRDASMKARGATFQHMPNRYSTQPPAYYAITGAWMRAGSALGLGGGRLVYWIRFFNIIPCVLVVLMGSLLAGSAFPKDPAVCIGTPMLLAVFPQDVNYAINSDALSAVLVGGVFLLLVSPRANDRPVSMGVLAGILGAFASLSKQSNIPVLAGMIAVSFLLAMKSRTGHARNTLLMIALAAAITGAGIAGWSAKSAMDAGDPTGMEAKWRVSGWSVKPPAEIPFHPVFTLSGAWFFTDNLIRTFWRGETVWHSLPMATADSDFFYVSSTLAFMITMFFSIWLRRKSRIVGRESGILEVGAGGLAGGILFLVAVSVIFDFRNSYYPSLERPYLYSGRLISGALIPLSLLYLRGLSAVTGLLPARIQKITNPAMLVALVCAYIMASEIRVTWEVFASGYNWFHLPR